jgi:opacity protein-like surface antigen
MRVRLAGTIGFGVFLFCAVSAAARSAEAQTPQRQPPENAGLFATVGVGSMTPLHSDDYSEGRPYLGGIRISRSAKFSIEVEVTGRTTTREYDRVNVVLPDFNCPTGQPCQTGHADRDLSRATSSDWTVGLDAVRRFPIARFGVFAGGGVMFHEEETRQTRTLTNCTNPGHVSSSFVDCAGFDQRASSNGMGFQGLAGLDVNITSRLQAYGGIRYEIRNDLGYGTFGATGGVRLRLR